MAKSRRRRLPSKRPDDAQQHTHPSSAQQLPARNKQLLADMNHREVERRVTAIRALCEASIEGILTQLRLAKSRLPESVLTMPLTRFLKLYCPNTEAQVLDSGFLELRKTNEARDHLNSFNFSLGFPYLSSVMPMENVSNFTVTKEHILQSVDRLLQHEKNEEWGKYYTSCRKNKHRDSSMQTPRMELRDRTKIGLTPKTERLPKLGEVLMSINGSPLGLYENDGITTIPEEQHPRRTRKRLQAVL